jgi:sulfur-oxidizing protein SoxY
MTSRRDVIAGAVALALLPLPASATPETARALLATLAKGTPRQGRIALRLPEVADNGASVPLTVAVESPMTVADHVKAVHVVADGNPNPGVASFRFTPAAGKAEVQTRIRLSESQRVTAVAEMSDGSLWTTTREVRVTLGGCAGG